MSDDTQKRSAEKGAETRREIAELRARAHQLETELEARPADAPFRPEGFYTSYHATAGFMLGMFGAVTSLLFNVVGSLMTGKHPLELIRVYLTFPLGDRALEMETGLAMAIGCCLYLATGMLLGMFFQVAFAWLAPDGPLLKHLLIGTVLGVVVWLVNFYVILSWLQPTLVDMAPENLIVNQVPWWVAVLTHLIFAWTMALVYPLGRFVPHSPVQDHSPVQEEP